MSKTERKKKKKNVQLNYSGGKETLLRNGRKPSLYLKESKTLWRRRNKKQTCLPVKAPEGRDRQPVKEDRRRKKMKASCGVRRMSHDLILQPGGEELQLKMAGQLGNREEGGR